LSDNGYWVLLTFSEHVRTREVNLNLYPPQLRTHVRYGDV